jgi:hypothetical protein
MDDKQKTQIEKYKILVQLIDFEIRSGWTIFGTWVIIHTLFLNFLLKVFFDEKFITNTNFSYLIISTIFGLILAFLWFITYERNSNYYLLRMEQAKTCEPDGWNILKNHGEKFANGKTVTIGDNDIKMNFFGRIFKANVCIRVLITIVHLLYLLILIYLISKGY